MAAVAEIDNKLLEGHRGGAKDGRTAEPVSWGVQGRHKACPYGDLIGLAGRAWFGETLSIGNLSLMSTPGR